MTQMILLSIVIITASFLDIAKTSPLPAAHTFDLGLLDSCTTPTSQQLSDCHQYINYPVPSVLLSDKILNIKHKRILAISSKERDRERAFGNSSLSDVCGENALKHECHKEFPPCYTMQDANKMVELSPSDPCLSNNPCLTYEPSCSNVNTNVSLTTCHVTSQFNDYNYTYCNSLNDWSNTYITKWMHALLQNAEQDIADFSSAFHSEQARSICLPLYAELLCGTVGRCSHQGTRAEMNATREVCIALMNCVGNNLRSSLEKLINCSHYPSISDKLPTEATPITQPTTPPTNSTINVTQPTETTTQGTSSSASTTTQEPSVILVYPPVRVTSSSYSVSPNYVMTLIFMCILIICYLL